MIEYTKKKLEDLGYTIENARITNVDLIMGNYGCFSSYITLDGSGWGANYGGYCLGHGDLGSEHFDGCSDSIEYLMRIMDVVGSESFNGMVGKYVRVAIKDGWGDAIRIIGNVLEDKWFDAESFFKDKKEESNA